MKPKNRRIVLWIFVIAYTFSLPYAIIAYEAITLKWSTEIAGFIPRLILILAAGTYFFYSIKASLPSKKKILLIPCGIIASIVICLESNPNKHIHIPEYILMTWLLFEVIRIDYEGAGIYLLVFLCSSFLGILDEVLQGAHPARYYGWQDMITNTTSSFIGALSLFGLRADKGAGWDWANHFKGAKWSLSIVVSSILATGTGCYMLFEVKGNGGLWDIYPVWLIFLEVSFIVVGFVNIWVLFPGKLRNGGEVTATLWVLLPLVIVWIINIVIIISWGVGLSFQ